MKPRRLGYSLALLVAALAGAVSFSCSLCEPHDSPDDASAGSGSSLVRYGSRLYLVGGNGEDGSPVNTVRSASVAQDGSAGEFEPDFSLPEALTFPGVIASGSMIYCLGGETAPGQPDAAILYTYISVDGTLGFSAEVGWESNEVSLPEPRSRAAVLLNDGWIYLIGGLIAENEYSDLIIRARVYQDGQVGAWYPAAALPSGRSRVAAAIAGGRMYIAGGLDDSGSTALDEVISFALEPYGALGDRQAEASLPECLYGAVLVDDGGDVLLAGGYTAAGESFTSVYKLSGTGWTKLEGIALGADGPSSGRAAGSFWYLPQGFVNDMAAPVSSPSRSTDLILGPETPQALPGSGRVPNNSPLRFRPEPGTTVRYEKNGLSVTASSAEYFTASPPAASGTSSPPVTSISLKAFGSNGRNSPEIRYDFIPGNVGFFVSVSDELTVDTMSPAFPGYQDFTMRESTTDTATYPDGYMPASSERFRLHIQESGTYMLRITDADTNADTGRAYTGRVSFSLVERDHLTEVPDIGGDKVSDVTAFLNPALELWLQAGTYYLRAVDVDGLTGRSFGVRASRR